MFTRELELRVRASFPCLYVVAREDWRCEQEIEKVAKKLKVAYSKWTVTRGFDGKKDLLDPLDAIKKIMGIAGIFSFVNFHRYLDDPQMIQTVKDLIQVGKAAGQTVVFVCNVWKLPDELQDDVSRLEFSLPDKELLLERLDYLVSDESLKDKALSVEERDKIAEAALGMTTWEAENAMALSLVECSKVDYKIIATEKARAVAKSGILEFYEPNVSMSDIGGLDNLKSWLKTRRNAFSKEAIEYGLPSPKGILLVGVPGCGKSLTAKAVASDWNLPLIRFDLGRLFQGLVGASEENVRRAIATAEAVAPCITGDTEITLGDGTLVKAEELYKSFEPGARVVAVDNDYRAYSVPLLAVLWRGAKRVAHIVTVGGDIQTTFDHKLLTQHGWQQVQDIAVGDFLYMPHVRPATSSTLSYAGLFPQDAKRLNGYYRRGKGGWTDSYLKTPESLSKEVGELLGYLDSDGSIERRRVSFFNSDPRLLDRFEYLVESLFQLVPVRRENTVSKGRVATFRDGSVAIGTKQSYVVHVNNKLFCDTLKILRSRLLRFDHAYLIPSYLRAFINGDGWIESVEEASMFRIAIIQKKPEQQRLIIELLRRVGIVARFDSRIQCEVSGGRARRLLDILHSGSGPDDDKVTRAHVPAIKGYEHHSGRTVKEAPNGAYVRVVSIEDAGNQETYDLCCEAVHTYLSNGFVSHNCVMWIDEIEKGMAGAGGSGSTDSGVTARVFGSLLSWLQDRKRPVFVVATGNQVQNLPPELMRAGRWDEMFSVDLPSQQERLEVFKIHLKKRNRDPDNFNLEYLSIESAQFSPAEIEQVIIKGMFKAFSDGREVSTEDLMGALSTTVPLSVTRREDIEVLRTWAQTRAVPASSSEPPKISDATEAVSRRKLRMVTTVEEVQDDSS